MFLFNTTFVVDTSAFPQWKEWMKSSYLPVLEGMVPVATFQVWELTSLESDDDSVTYSCQWQCDTPDALGIINKYSSVLISNLVGTLGEKVLHFSSILQKSDLF